MLTVRHARPEMRAPCRTWLRANARMLIVLGLAAGALLVVSFPDGHCAAMATGQWDCPMAGDGLFALQFGADPDSPDCVPAGCGNRGREKPRP